MGRDRSAPPTAAPEAGPDPGYAEDKPRDRGDARRPHGRQPPSPDEGGLRRAPDEPASDEGRSAIRPRAPDRG